MRIEKCQSHSGRLTLMPQVCCLHSNTRSLQCVHFLYIRAWCSCGGHGSSAWWCCATDAANRWCALTYCCVGDSGVCLQNRMSCCSYRSPALPVWRLFWFPSGLVRILSQILQKNIMASSVSSSWQIFDWQLFKSCRPNQDHHSTVYSQNEGGGT